MSSKEIWTQNLFEHCNVRFVVPEFLETLAPLNLTPEQIKGNILIIGHAGGFPERSLLCTPKSSFATLRDSINSVFCCDPDEFSSPNLMIKAPCTNTISCITICNPQPKHIYYEMSSSYDFLPKIKEEFLDAVLMFRIVDLGEQIAQLGLFDLISTRLKRDGYFLGSGGRFKRLKLPACLELVRRIELSNPSGDYPFDRHTGIILQKIF